MPVTKVEVRGLRDFTRELRRLEGGLQKQMRQIHQKAADLVAPRARAASPSRVAGAISGRATQKAARLQVVDRPPYALGVFMGALRRFGWYRAARYAQSTGRQFEPWVGNQWDPGAAGGAPYHIGPAINASIDDVIELMGDEIEQLAGRAFPDGS